MKEHTHVSGNDCEDVAARQCDALPTSKNVAVWCDKKRYPRRWRHSLSGGGRSRQ